MIVCNGNQTPTDRVRRAEPAVLAIDRRDVREIADNSLDVARQRYLPVFRTPDLKLLPIIAVRAARRGADRP